MIKHTILIVILVSGTHPATAQTLTKFTAAKCLSLDPASTIIDFCFIKAYSRTLSVFNLGLTLVKPAYKPMTVRTLLPLKMTRLLFFLLSVPHRRELQVWKCFSRSHQ